MEPLPETGEALSELERFGDTTVREHLRAVMAVAKTKVPSLVGVSLTLVPEDLVLTYVASDHRIAVMDAVQYVDGGPCIDAVDADRVVLTDVEGLLDEARWQLFAQVTAVAGVRSTLSMPLRQDGTVTGGVNLYGGDSSSFRGLEAWLANLFGAWAPGAVANADLSFSTRLEAVRGPAKLRGRAYVDQAVGLLVGARGIDPGDAEARLQRAAAQAGTTVLALARALVVAFVGGS
jgi:GAF domain-containing protein